MSHTLNRSSQETVLMKNDACDKRKEMPTRNSCEIEPCLFCNQCDTHMSAEGTLSTNSLFAVQYIKQLYRKHYLIKI